MLKVSDLPNIKMISGRAGIKINAVVEIQSPSLPLCYVAPHGKCSSRKRN